jgi:hypothetical protein
MQLLMVQPQHGRSQLAGPTVVMVPVSPLMRLQAQGQQAFASLRGDNG